MSINSILLPNIHKIKVIYCMDIFSASGMILRSLINKASKIRITNFSISFFSKVVQWYIEHYSRSTKDTQTWQVCVSLLLTHQTFSFWSSIFKYPLKFTDISCCCCFFFLKKTANNGVKKFG